MAAYNRCKIVVWERANKVGKWCAYSPEVSQLLEISLRKNMSNVCLGDAHPDLKIYSVNLQDFIQESQITGTKLAVRRRLCGDLTAVGRGFTWQWHGDGHDVWYSYDADISDFIERSFLEGKNSINLCKTFPHYNFELDFTKMLQTSKRTRRKRAIRRQQNISPYPVVNCEESPVYNEDRIDDIDMAPVTAVPEILSPAHLAQEIPGTNALMTQVNEYFRNVKESPAYERDDTAVTSHEEKKGKKTKHADDSGSYKDEKIGKRLDLKQNSVSKFSSAVAIVNGKPWTDSWPPHTPQSKLKPVPGIDPLPKLRKSKTSKNKESDMEVVTPINTIEKYSEAVVVSNNAEQQTCIICCEMLSNVSSYEGDSTVLKLALCSHMFHKACLEAMYNSGPKENFLQCPTCKKIYGEKCGTQPPGDMIYHVLPYSLPGYPENGTIRIIYDISSGIQGPEHPKPGKRYTARGFPRHCYLPDNEIGRKVLRLLIKAWKRRLIFTIGTSSTTGEENTVTWNEIHHKTEFGCNRRGHGYPDPDYFDNVLAELEAHGVTDDEVYQWYPAE